MLIFCIATAGKYWWIKKKKKSKITFLVTLILLSSNWYINCKSGDRQNYKSRKKLFLKYQKVKQISLICILSLYVYKKREWNSNKELCLKAHGTGTGSLACMQIANLLKSCYNGTFYFSIKMGERKDQRLLRTTTKKKSGLLGLNVDITVPRQSFWQYKVTSALKFKTMYIWK